MLVRDLLTGLAILVIAALCAAVAVPFVIDWNRWRAQVEDYASTAIGKPVKITGPLNVRFLPAPVLRVGDFRIGGQDDHASATAKKAKVELSITALLRGEFRITDATLEGAVLGIRADRPGTDNTVVVPTLKDIPLAAIDQLHIVDGAVSHTSVTGKVSEPVRGNFSVEAVSLKGPWRIIGRAIAEERGYDLRISTGVLDGNGKLPLKLSIADAGLAFVADLDGAAVLDGKNPGTLPKIEGRLTASGAFPWPFGKQAGLQPWRLQAQGASTPKGFTAQQIEIEAGPQDTAFRATGEGRLDIAEGLDATLILKARPLDLDKMRATDEPQRTPRQEKEIIALMENALIAPPFPVALKIEGDTIVYNAEMVGPYTLDAELMRGRFHISQFGVSAPGQSRISIQGAAALAAQPQFDGTVKISSGNPAKTWSWLTQAPIDPAAAPRFARMRDMIGETTLTATPETVTAHRFRLQLDGAPLTGEARYRFARQNSRARMDATLQAEQLDLDLFPSAQSGGAGGIDFSIAIDAKNLTARSLNAQSLGALSLIARSDDAGLNIEQFELRGGDKARMSGSGKIGVTGGKIEARIDAADTSPLLVAAHRLFPALNLGQAVQRAAAFSPAALTLTIERKVGDQTNAAVTGSLGPSQIDATLGGVMRKRPNDTWDGALENGTVKITTPDFAQFLQQLGAGLSVPPAHNKIPASITVRSGSLFVQGNDLRKRPDWIFEGDIGGLAFSAKGISTEGYVPTGNGPFTLASADASALLRLLGVMDSAPSAKIPLALKGTAEFGLGGLRAQTITGRIGTTEMTGGMVHWPFLPDAKLRGNLAFSQFSLADLGAFLLGPETASGSGQWPSGRFSESRKPLVDFDVEVTARTMPFASLLMAQNASMRIANIPGGIRMPGFGADIAGGRLGFHMTFKHEGTLVSASGRIEATGTDPAAFGVRALSGKFDTILDVASVGESVTQIMQALGGAGSIATRNMRIAALDPLAASRVHDLWQGKEAPSNPAVLAAAIEQELPKAAWGAGNMTLPLTITRGVARIGPAQNELNNIHASGQAVADLRTASINAALTLALRTETVPIDFTVNWAGPLAAPKLSIDPSTLQSRLQLAAISREQERISVLEQDARERAAFNRRARAEKELREREEAKKQAAEEMQRRADAERKAAEEAMQRAAQERKTLEDMARRTSEQQRALENTVPRLLTPPAPSAPLQITPR